MPLILRCSGQTRLVLRDLSASCMPAACEASVSVGFSARSRHFSLFGGAKTGASATCTDGRSPFSHFFALAPIFARSNSGKFFKPAKSPTETLAMQAMHAGLNVELFYASKWQSIDIKSTEV